MTDQRRTHFRASIDLLDGDVVQCALSTERHDRDVLELMELVAIAASRLAGHVISADESKQVPF